MNLTCTCIAHQQKVMEAAASLRTEGKGWTPAIVMMLLKKTGSTFPPTIRKGKHVINKHALAHMLGNRNDRTLLSKAFERVGDAAVGSVGFCKECSKPLPVEKPPRETEEQRKERYQREIKEILEEHPDIAQAVVSVWKEAAGEGLAVDSEYAKTVFDAKLTLVDGTCIDFDMLRPSRRANKEYPATIIEYQSRQALRNRIKNRRFLYTPYDHDKACFPGEKDCRAYEKEVRQKYSDIRKISPACLEVKLLTTQDLAPGNKDDFMRICSNRNRYYCEVTVRVPGNDGKPGPIMHLEHVSLRSLTETASSKSCMNKIRSRFMQIQSRYVQPLLDFEWWRQEDGGGKLRRMTGYQVGSGGRETMYSFAMLKTPRPLSTGKRFFGEPDAGTRYLSLVEVCDQQTGNLELKWCLTTDHCLKGEDGTLVPHDQNNLYSVVRRYRSEAGTRKQLEAGKKWYFQVQRILAYCHGDNATMQQLDATLKRKTVQYQCNPAERNNMTEFRSLDGLEDCISLFKAEAANVGVDYQEPQAGEINRKMLIRPERTPLSDWFKTAGQAA